jgi:DNA gyrase subunit B
VAEQNNHDNEKKYDASSFKMLEGVEPIRVNPHLTLDGSGMKAIFQLLREVTDNVIDESKEVKSRKIVGRVKLFPDGTVEISDNARGIPVGMTEYGLPAVYLAFERMNAGSKIKGFSSYARSVGANGIGLSAVNACSKRLDITVKRDGEVWHVAYEMGKRVEDLHKVGTCPKDESGTTVKFLFDDTVLHMKDEHRSYTYPYRLDDIKKHFADYVTFNKNVEFYLEWETPIDGHGEMEFTSAFTPEVLVSRGTNGKPLKYAYESTEIDCGAEFHFAVSLDHADRVQMAAINGSRVMRGQHVSAFEDRLVEFIVTIFRSRGYIQADLALDRDLILERISYIVMVNTDIKQYKGQVKDEFSAYDVGYDIRNQLNGKFDDVFESAELNTLVDDLREVYLMRLEEFRAMKRARENKKINYKKETVAKDLSKFYDCENGPKMKNQNSVWFLEGNSAAGTFSSSRNVNNMAYVELQGKPLNVNKRSDVESLEKNITFRLIDHVVRMDKFTKFIICTDGDTDGLHIQLLISLIFYKHFPEVIESGQLFICYAPLYRGHKGAETAYFLENEYEEALRTGYTIGAGDRFKGLGEMKAKDMIDSMINGGRFVRVSPQSFGKLEGMGMSAEHIILRLTSNDTSARKEILKHMAHEDLLDYYENQRAVKRQFDSKINPMYISSDGMPMTQDDIDLKYGNFEDDADVYVPGESSEEDVLETEEVS